MEILYGALAYIIVTFPLAVLWHMKVFRTRYLSWQYFGDDAMPALGLASMVVQGIVLSYGYSVLDVDHTSLSVGIGYALVMGLFLWSTHVLAAIAKSAKLRNMGFLTMETIYLAIQFGVFGILVSLTY